MGRTTYYNWIDDDKDFETEVQNVNEELIDYAESQLHTKNISRQFDRHHLLFEM